MKPIGRNTYFGAHPKFATVGELRGGVVKDNRAVYPMEEPVRGSLVIRHDRFSVSRAIGRNVGHGPINSINHARRDDRVEVFRVPIFLGSGQYPGINLLDGGIPSYLTPGFEQVFDNRPEVRADTCLIYQKRLRCPTNARTPQLGVHGDGSSHTDVSIPIDINVTVALEVPNNRHTRFLLDARYQALAPSWNNHVDVIGHLGQHVAHGSAIRDRHELNTFRGQSARCQSIQQAGMNGPIRKQALRPAAQDHGVARFEAKSPGVGRNVGPALINDANDTERHAYTLNVQAVRPIPLRRDRSHRVGERDDFFNAACDGFDTLRIESQPIQQGSAQLGNARRGHVSGIGFEDFASTGPNRRGGTSQRLILRPG